MSNKNSFFILIIALAIIMPTSCKKKGEIEYSFDGKIVQSISGGPVSGVAVKISQQIILNGTTAEGHTTGGSATTDAAGKFEITFDREKVTEFLLKFSKTDYFTLEKLVSSANVSTENVNTFNESLEPKSWVNLEIKNSFPNESDHFKLVTHNFREGCLGCTENTTVSYFGALDTTISILTTPGRYTRFTYINVTGGVSHTDSVYTTPFEVNTYEIIY